MIQPTSSNFKSKRRYSSLTKNGVQTHGTFNSADEILHEMDLANRVILEASNSQSRIAEALNKVIHGLYEYRQKTEDRIWTADLSNFRDHPMTSTVHQDPFTRRAFEKPRGYAGDAELLDYIYGIEERWAPPEMSSVGKSIFEYTTASPAPEGVRARRGFVADLIDAASAKNRDVEILSIAAGHLREAHISAAIRRSRFGRVVALDADRESLDLVDREYGTFGVETIEANVRELMTGRFDLGKFDLIYSTGLFDYLNERAARNLVTRTFDMLNPGGELVIANFLPGIRDIGYMDVFMDWQLVYRSRKEVIDMTMGIPLEEIAGIQLFAEDNQNIIFLSVTKR